jgi:hypothetical protein
VAKHLCRCCSVKSTPPKPLQEATRNNGENWDMDGYFISEDHKERTSKHSTQTGQAVSEQEFPSPQVDSFEAKGNPKI